MRTLLFHDVSFFLILDMILHHLKNDMAERKSTLPRRRKLHQNQLRGVEKAGKAKAACQAGA